MDDFEQLCANLACERNNLTNHSSRIAGVQSEINQSIQRAQTYFGDQPVGQEIVRLLYIALNDLARADSAVYVLGTEITTYVAELQK